MVRSARVIVFSSILTLFALGPAKADHFPNKPIRLIVGAGTGGGTDTLARLAADKVSKDLGQPVVVENRRAIVAASELRSQAADGYTVGFIQSSTITFDPLVMKSGFKPDDVDILFVTVRRSTGIIASRQASFKDWDGFIAYARKNGSFSAAASTLTQRLAIQKIGKAIGSRAKVIAAGGGADARVALLGRHVDVSVTGSAGFAETKAGGPFELIALTDTQRNEDYTSYPTVKEKGIDVAIDDHFALIAPRGTPQDASEKLAEAFSKAFASDEITRFVDTVIAGSPFSSKLDGGRAVINEEYERFKILTSNLKK